MAIAMIGPKFYAWDRDGYPLAFGELYTYQSRTNIPKATYRSEDKIVPNTNPVILNGEGYADIYLDGSYKIVLKDFLKNEIWSSDPVSAAEVTEWVNCFTATYENANTFKIYGNHVNYYKKGRKVRLNNNETSYQFETIKNSSFSNNETFVTIINSSIKTGLIGVCAAIVSPDSSFSYEDIKGLTGYGFNSVEDMILGKTPGGIIIDHVLGDVYSSGATNWKVINLPAVSINDFNALNEINVKDFGALGNGIIDDKNAIQKALDACQGDVDVYDAYKKAGSKVYFPAGTYLISDRLLITKNRTSIFGAGRGASIIKYTGNSIIRELIRFMNVHNCSIEDLTINGGLDAFPSLTELYGATGGLILDLCYNFTAENITIERTRIIGILAIHLKYSAFYNISFQELGHFSNSLIQKDKGGAFVFSNDSSWKESSDELGTGFESHAVSFYKPVFRLPCAFFVARAITEFITINDFYSIAENYDNFFPALNSSKFLVNNALSFKILNGFLNNRSYSFESDCFFIEDNNSLNSTYQNISIKNESTLGFIHLNCTTLIDITTNSEVNINGLNIYDKSDLLNNETFIINNYISDTEKNKGFLKGDVNIFSSYTRPDTDFFMSDINRLGIKEYNGSITNYNYTDYSSVNNIYYQKATKYKDYNDKLILDLTPSILAYINYDGTIAYSHGIISVTRTSLGYCDLILDVKKEVVNRTIIFANPLDPDLYLNYTGLVIHYDKKDYVIVKTFLYEIGVFNIDFSFSGYIV